MSSCLCFFCLILCVALIREFIMCHLSPSVELQSADPNHRGHRYDFERDPRSRGAGRTDSFYSSIITSHLPTVCEIPVCCVTEFDRILVFSLFFMSSSVTANMCISPNLKAIKMQQLMFRGLQQSLLHFSLTS